MILLRWVNFRTQIPECDFHSPALLDILLSSDTSICFTSIWKLRQQHDQNFQWRESHFPSIGNSDHVAVSVSIDFPVNSKQDTLFHRVAYDYPCAEWHGLHDHLKNVP